MPRWWFGKGEPKEPVRGALFAKNYQLLEPLGRGGQAAAWLAWRVRPVSNADKALGNHVVLKIGQASSRQRLELEKKRLELLDGQHHVIRLLGSGLWHNPPYLVLEPLFGPSLEQLLGEHSLDYPEVIRVLVLVGDALTHLHAHGIIHRDVTPANIQLHAHNTRGAIGRIGEVKLIDLGIAFVAGEPRVTEERRVIGPRHRTAPEVRQGLPAERGTDVYNLALVAFEMLRGWPLAPSENFEAMSRELFAEQLDEFGRIRIEGKDEALPAEVKDVLLRALSDKPSARPQSIEVFLAPLTRALTNLGEASPSLQRMVTAITVPREIATGESAPEKQLELAPGLELDAAGDEPDPNDGVTTTGLVRDPNLWRSAQGRRPSKSARAVLLASALSVLGMSGLWLLRSQPTRLLTDSQLSESQLSESQPPRSETPALGTRVDPPRPDSPAAQDAAAVAPAVPSAAPSAPGAGGAPVAPSVDAAAASVAPDGTRPEGTEPSATSTAETARPAAGAVAPRATTSERRTRRDTQTVRRDPAPSRPATVPTRSLPTGSGKFDRSANDRLLADAERARKKHAGSPGPTKGTSP